jgi:hypothetical protein
MDELGQLKDDFYRKFGHPPQIGAWQSIEDFKQQIRTALETGQPGFLIRPRMPGLIVD